MPTLSSIVVIPEACIVPVRFDTALLIVLNVIQIITKSNHFGTVATIKQANNTKIIVTASEISIAKVVLIAMSWGDKETKLMET